MKQWYKKRRRMTAAFAVAIAGAAVTPVYAESADAVHPFIEYQDWADVGGVVAVSRYAAGNPVEEYEFCDTVFRFDVNCDGVVSEKDAEIMADYVRKYALFDAVFEQRPWDDVQQQYRAELAERYNALLPYVSVFFGFRPDEVVYWYADYVMADRIVTIADGGRTGYAVQEDPFCGDVVYETEYGFGDIVIIYNVYTEGNPDVIVESAEFCIGNVEQYGFEYQPDSDIVARALLNID